MVRRLALAIVLSLTGCAMACGHPPATRSAQPTSRPIQNDGRNASTPLDRVLVGPSTASPVTFTRIAKSPEPGWNAPRAAQFSADGKLTFLSSESGDETMALFAFDPATGKSEVLLRAK